MSKYHSLPTAVLTTRIAEFMTDQEFAKLETQIFRLAEYVHAVVGSGDKREFVTIYNMLEHDKLAKLYSQLVHHLNKHNGNRFYSLSERGDYSLMKEARDIIKDYKHNKFFMPKEETR